MPKREGGTARDLADRIGQENWATLEDVVREVFARVGPRVLQWRVAWGIEPLIGLVVLHTCVVTAREMRLGELAEEIKTTAGELAEARRALVRAEQDRDIWRRAAEAETQGGRARAAMLARVEGVLAQFRELADGSGSNRVNFPHDMGYAASVLGKALRGDDV